MSLAARTTNRLRWLRRSSTMRLSLLLSGVFAAGMIVAILVALDLGEDAIQRRVDTTLQALARAATLDETRGDEFAVIIRSPTDLRDLPPPFERAARRGVGTVELDRDFRRAENWRVMVTEDSRGTPILIAVPLDDSEEALELLAEVLWTTAFVVVAVALAIGLGAGFLAQRRLARINDTLARLATGDLVARTGTARSRDDLDDIARQLDTTAAELERLVAQTRNLSASLAHDLRTPLARLRARLEMLPEGEERAAALDEAARLSDIFDTIMRVARIEAAHGSDGFEPVDLQQLVDDLAEIFGPVIEDENKRLRLDVANAATVMADRQMLVQAMANLIQNALVHGGDEITLFAHGGDLGVADNGQGVDPSQYAEIIKPMTRLDAARANDGTGLGLALVRAVSDRHGAELALSKADPNGLCVALKFANL